MWSVIIDFLGRVKNGSTFLFTHGLQITAMYISIRHHPNFYDIHLKTNIFSKL